MKKVLKVTLKIAVFFIGWVVCTSIGEINSANPAIWRFGAELFPLLWTLLFTGVFLYMEKGKVKIPVFQNLAKGSAVGFVTGAVWLGMSVGLLTLFGSLHITAKNEVGWLGLWIISAFLNTVMQEFLVRGYIYQLLKKEYSVVPAAIVSTVLFTFMHGGTLEAGLVPVLNVVTMSLFMTALYEREKTIAAPILCHAVWNIIGAIILGGVSLADDYPSLFTMKAAGNALLSGGEYRIEASVVVLALNILLGFFFYEKSKRKASAS